MKNHKGERDKELVRDIQAAGGLRAMTPRQSWLKAADKLFLQLVAHDVGTLYLSMEK